MKNKLNRKEQIFGVGHLFVYSLSLAHVAKCSFWTLQTSHVYTELAVTESPFQLALRADFYQGFGKQVGTMTNMLSHHFYVCMGLIENM